MTTTPALNDDLVRRLRAIDEAAMYEAPATTKSTVDEAAAALEAQSKEIEALRAALEPFAEAADDLDDGDKDHWELWDHSVAMDVTIGDLRRARTALKGA